MAKLLKGLDFPANKSKIVQHARQNRNDVADPDQVINALDNLPDREYNGPVDVEEQFGKEK